MTKFADRAAAAASKMKNETLGEIKRATKQNNISSVELHNATRNVTAILNKIVHAKEEADHANGEAIEATLISKQVSEDVTARAARISGLVTSVAQLMERASMAQQQTIQAGVM